MPRFDATPSTILSHLSATQVKMHPETTHWTARFGGKIAKYFVTDLGSIGVGVATNQIDLYPCGVALGFTRQGASYEFTCDQYDSTWDNLRAAQQGISWSWRIYKEYGVRSGHAGDTLDPFDRVFVGHRVAPLALAERWGNWWEVLGVARDTPLDEIKKTWHRQMKAIHPDNVDGGNEYLARALNAAYDAARKERGA